MSDIAAFENTLIALEIIGIFLCCEVLFEPRLQKNEGGVFLFFYVGRDRRMVKVF